MSYLYLKVKKSEDYVDIHNEIMLDDFMDNPKAFDVYVMNQDALTAENAKLRTALDRVMAEMKVSTDRAFYEHCKPKVDRILS